MTVFCDKSIPVMQTVSRNSHQTHKCLFYIGTIENNFSLYLSMNSIMNFILRFFENSTGFPFESGVKTVALKCLRRELFAIFLSLFRKNDVSLSRIKHFCT
jgi:hypothetical protein